MKSIQLKSENTLSIIKNNRHLKSGNNSENNNCTHLKVKKFNYNKEESFLASVKERQLILQQKNKNSFQHIFNNSNENEVLHYQNSIENIIGTVQMPLGLVGPLKVDGKNAVGEFYLPLATTEGALIASYNRGAKAANLAGGINSICIAEGVQRSPIFKFHSLKQAYEFSNWLIHQEEVFKSLVQNYTQHGKLKRFDVKIEGNQVAVIFDFTTGDAAGQNMVTICTNGICKYILEAATLKPEIWYIEGNFSGDKKATSLSFGECRGKKVSADVIIPKDIVVKVLKSTPEKMAKYWISSATSSSQSGTIGIQGQFANALAALFIATGQDVACVAEAATGISRMELTDNGDLYASVTLPNLIVGTVGGGTSLPHQKEGLLMMECYGKGKAKKYSELVAALVLSGELSIAAAISGGHFTRAHEVFGRKKMDKKY